jgi:predicted transcriptional regulator
MTPAQVRDALDPDLAYTTVMTVLARLHDKGQVSREPSGRGYAYRAPTHPADVTAQRMQRLLNADADRAAVLTRFAGTLGTDDAHLLRNLLDGITEGGMSPSGARDERVDPT